jgi:hypothetical protein
MNTYTIAFALEMLAVCMTLTGLILILLDRRSETLTYLRNTITLVSKIQITMSEEFDVVKAALTGALGTIEKIGVEQSKILALAEANRGGFTADQVTELIGLSSSVKNAADAVDAIVPDDAPVEPPVEPTAE